MFFIAMGVFVIAPYALFLSVTGGLADGTTVFGDMEVLVNSAWVWVSDIIKYALPLVLLSILIGFYRAGSYARIPLRILFALYLCSWIWAASHGGVFTMTLTDASIAVDVKYIVYVMMMISFAMIFLAFSEFGGNRKRYLEALEKKKDTMSKRKARRLSG
jgi:hypothetical protein